MEELRHELAKAKVEKEALEAMIRDMEESSNLKEQAFREASAKSQTEKDTLHMELLYTMEQLKALRQKRSAEAREKDRQMEDLTRRLKELEKIRQFYEISEGTLVLYRQLAKNHEDAIAEKTIQVEGLKQRLNLAEKENAALRRKIAEFGGGSEEEGSSIGQGTQPAMSSTMTSIPTPQIYAGADEATIAAGIVQLFLEKRQEIGYPGFSLLPPPLVAAVISQSTQPPPNAMPPSFRGNDYHFTTPRAIDLSKPNQQQLGHHKTSTSKRFAQPSFHHGMVDGDSLDCVCGRSFKYPHLLKRHVDYHRGGEVGNGAVDYNGTHPNQGPLDQAQTMAETKNNISFTVIKKINDEDAAEQLLPNDVPQRASSDPSQVSSAPSASTPYPDRYTHGIIGDGLSCPCGKSYRTLRDLRRHIRYYADKLNKDCGLCRGSFTTYGQLSRHMRAAHPAAISTRTTTMSQSWPPPQLGNKRKQSTPTKAPQQDRGSDPGTPQPADSDNDEESDDDADYYEDDSEPIQGKMPRME